MKQFKTINQNKVDMEICYKKQALIDIMKSDEELGLYDENKTNNIMKQTAVEWLCEQYHLKQDIEIVKQAKEMERQQGYSEEDIENAFLAGWELRDGDLPFAKAKNKWFNEFKKEIRL